MGQISEVRRSLVDIWKKIAGVVCDLQGPFLFAGFAQYQCFGRLCWVVRIGVPILCCDEAVAARIVL